MAPRKRRSKAEKQATETVKRIYQEHCGFIPIGVFDISKVLEVGEASVLAGDSEDVTRRKIVAFVEEIRKDKP